MGEFFVYSFFFGAVAFLFPVYVYLDAYTDVKENKCWFSLSLYKYLKVFGGYAQLKATGIALHLTKKTAIFLPYAEMAGMRQKFEITKGFQLTKYRQVIEYGGKNSAAGILAGAFLHSVFSEVFAVLQTYHPFLSLNNTTLLTEKGSVKVSVQTAVVFNGAILTVAFAKKTLEAFLKWMREKKLTAFWKKRQNSL